VQRRSAYFLLFLFLLSNTCLRELGKIGMLYDHFQEHQVNNPSITVSEFIAIHYFSGNVKDEDYSRDMQLPFKILHSAVPTFDCTQPQMGMPSLKPPTTPLNHKIIPQKQSAISPSHCADIWQPPKSC
jgi:hypothetical protein